ncbi:MAG: hypothetical protein LBQ88_05540 [Treponema sp.]|jgi:hypothetical protein|nr:hypothetical protein [Treponema sp.]
MKNYVSFFFCFLLIILEGSAVLLGDEILKRNDGRDIILHENFTWEYREDPGVQNGPIERLDISANLTGQLNSRSGKFTVYYDPIEWHETTGLNPSAEIQMSNTDSTGFCILIMEGIPLSVEQMKDVVILNARRMDSNAHVVQTERVLVNGKEGTIFTYIVQYETLRFIFYNLIMSNEKGSIQFVFYTIDSVFEQLKPDFRKAMSGLIF